MKRIFKVILLIGVLLVIHAVLLRWLHAEGAAAQLLAHGPQTPVSVVILVGFYLFVRIILYVLLPSLLATRLLVAAATMVFASKRTSE